jgi:hypothetical protein
MRACVPQQFFCLRFLTVVKQSKLSKVGSWVGPQAAAAASYELQDQVRIRRATYRRGGLQFYLVSSGESRHTAAATLSSDPVAGPRLRLFSALLVEQEGDELLGSK